ncbi:MAG: NAD-dependent epimerase/dehydratase family protein [Nitrospinae bacterium]|nr:NAD-dependent epimerase/dehydratase family protein [Nitrospinota bacterium]
MTEKWLVTGCAGFIGSAVMEALLRTGATVAGVDDLSHGSMENINDAINAAGPGAGERFTFYHGSVLDPALMEKAAIGARIVSHHAALCSVPLSFERPEETFRVNAGGLESAAKAAASAGARRIIYASSAAVYGDGEPPLREDSPPYPKSPYAESKLANDRFAADFSAATGAAMTGLRYFNVYGPRQNTQGQYGGVIGRWTQSMLDGETPTIFGDPSISRDFIFVKDAAMANILASRRTEPGAVVLNIATGRETTLGKLYETLAAAMAKAGINAPAEPLKAPARPDDIVRSVADISRAAALMDFKAASSLEEGLLKTVKWFKGKL